MKTWENLTDKERLNCNICSKQMKNYNGLSIHLSKKHNIKLEKYVRINFENKKCECGCNILTKFHNSTGKYKCTFPTFSNFINGHSGRTEKAKNASKDANSGREPPNKIIFTLEEIDHILNMYNENWSMNSIADFYNLKTYRAIQRVINDNKHKISKRCFSRYSILEYKMSEILKELNLKFEHQRYYKLPDIYKNWIRNRGPVVDFYLNDYKLVIECDGEKWHSINKDEEVNFIVKYYGDNIMRFSSKDIMKNIKSVKEKIKMMI